MCVIAYKWFVFIFGPTCLTNLINNYTLFSCTFCLLDYFVWLCCNFSVDIVVNVWFTTNGICAKNNTIYMWHEQAIIEWLRRVISIVACCLGLSDHNKMVLWPGCEGHAGCSLHTKNMRSVQFGVVKRRRCCCNLSAGVALNARFTTNGMQRTTRIYM